MAREFVEFAGEDRVTAVRGEIGVIDPGAIRRRDVALQRHGVRVAELEAPHRLGDDDCGGAVGGEIDVVGIGNVDGLADLARPRIDRRDAAMSAARAHIRRNPQGLKIPRRNDMFRARHHSQAVDDLERLRIDDVDLAGHDVRRIDARWLACDSGTEHAGPRASVDVMGIDRRRHRQVCGRQKDRPLGTELIGCERDKVCGRMVLIVEAAANMGAIRCAERASVRNGQRLRTAQLEARAHGDRRCGRCGQALAKSHPVFSQSNPSAEPRFGATREAKTATATMTVR